MIKKICFEDTGPWWALVFGEIWSRYMYSFFFFFFFFLKKGNSTFDLFKWDFEGVRTGSKNSATKALQTRGGGAEVCSYARPEKFLI